MELEGIMLKEVTQKDEGQVQKDFSHMWDIKIWKGSQRQQNMRTGLQN